MYEVYDLNQDTFVSREEIFGLLKDCLPNRGGAADDDPEEGIKDLIEILMKKLVKPRNKYTL